MAKKIFAYKRSVKLTKKQLAELSEEGFIPIKVELLDDVKIVEHFPDVDNTWLLSTALDLIMNSSGYSSEGLKNKLGLKILEHLRAQIGDDETPPGEKAGAVQEGKRG